MGLKVAFKYFEKLNKARIKSGLKKHKTLISNFNYLSVLQLFQLLFPLITYPYLIRVLGKEIYGVVVFSNAIIMYLSVFINFGFDISEIKEISIFRDNKKKVSEILSTVLTIRIIFALISALILSTLIVIIPELNKHKWLYIASMGLLLDAAINPSFYFLGIEKMKFITYLSVTSKFVFLILIFIVIKKPAHYILVPLLTSIGTLLSSLIGLSIIFHIQKVQFTLPSLYRVKEMITNSLPFFTSRVSVLAINKTNILLLGTFVGYTEVAYYDLAEKLVNVMKMPFNIFNQVLFPNVSKTKNIGLVKKTLKYLLGVYILGYLSLYIFSEPFIQLIGGIELVQARFVLYILGVSAITELISVFLGAPMLLAMGYKREYNGSIIIGSLFYILLISILYIANLLGLYSLATATVASSSFILIYRTWFCKKFNLI